MITITVKDLLNIIPILRTLADKPFKGAVAFNLARLMREIDQEVASFEAARVKLVEKYGKRDEINNFIFDSAGNVLLKEDKVEECNEEMLELLNTSIKINVNKIPAEAFLDIEITPSQIIVLDTLIDY